METLEQASLKEAVRLVFDWIRDRRPGPATLAWSTGSESHPITMRLVFSSMKLRPDEDEFLPEERRIFSSDIAMPESLYQWERVRLTLMRVGAQFSLDRAEPDGLSATIALPADASQPDEAIAKIRVIEGEISRQQSFLAG